MHRLVLTTTLMLASLWLGPSSAFADTRGIRVDGKTPEEFIAAQTGKSYAVVIGINNYEKVPRLTYAKADAESIAKTLKQRGFAVTELYDKQASRRNILSELGDKLVDRVKEEDRVLIFYAGHGETKQRTGGKEIGYLLPVGGEQDALAETAIPMSMIRDLADALPAKQVLFLVDVCYGGIAGQQFRSLPKYTVDYLKAITRERGRQLITAGGPKQQAMEGPEWGHSVFTYYLLEGLDKGRADLNDDGIIPATELYAYLDERVFGAASLKGHDQRPVMWTMAAEKGEFVFFTSRGSQVTGLAPASAPVPVPGPSAALSQAERELQALHEQERQLEEQQKLAAMQAQIEAKKKALEEKQKQIEIAKAPAFSAPQPTDNQITGKDGAPMVLVPAGDFLYGDNNQRLSLPAFYMDKYEVSTAHYAAYMAAAGATQPEFWPTAVLVSNGRKPVVGVSWHEADAYCRYYGKRLPTEQEWEKAARGTDGRTYPWGNEAPTSRHANFGKLGFNDYGVLVNVGSLEEGKSPYGIYDLAGNVWEWTSSDYDSTSKVVRGGSWYNSANNARSALRYYYTSTYRDANIGFRCAKTP